MYFSPPNVIGNFVLVVFFFRWEINVCHIIWVTQFPEQSQFQKIGYHSNCVCSRFHSLYHWPAWTRQEPLWARLFIWKLRGLGHLVSRYSSVLEFCCLVLIWFYGTVSGLCSEGTCNVEGSWEMADLGSGEGKNQRQDCIDSLFARTVARSMVSPHSRSRGTECGLKMSIRSSTSAFTFPVVFFYGWKLILDQIFRILAKNSYLLLVKTDWNKPSDSVKAGFITVATGPGPQ